MIPRMEQAEVLQETLYHTVSETGGIGEVMLGVAWSPLKSSSFTAEFWFTARCVKGLSCFVC